MSENTQVDRSQQEYFEKMKYFEDLVGSQASYFAFSLATKRRVLGYDWIIFVAGRDRVFSTPGKLCAQGMRRRMCAIALYCCDLCTYGGSRGNWRFLSAKLDYLCYAIFRPSVCFLDATI